MWTRPKTFPDAAGRATNAGSKCELHAEVGSPVSGWDGTAGWWSGHWRTLSRFRRLRVRNEVRADIHLAFAQLACCLITCKQHQRFC